MVGILQVGLLAGTLKPYEGVMDGSGEGRRPGGGQGDNDLLLGDPTHPFVVQEGSNCDWLWCKQMYK